MINLSDSTFLGIPIITINSENEISGDTLGNFTMQTNLFHLNQIKIRILGCFSILIKNYDVKSIDSLVIFTVPDYRHDQLNLFPLPGQPYVGFRDSISKNKYMEDFQSAVAHNENEFLKAKINLALIPKVVFIKANGEKLEVKAKLEKPNFNTSENVVYEIDL